jgi:hypothetical protein
MSQTHRLVVVNGQAGLVGFKGRQPSWVLTIETDGVRILSAYAVVNPDKLRGIAALDALASDDSTLLEGDTARREVSARDLDHVRRVVGRSNPTP